MSRYKITFEFESINKGVDGIQSLSVIRKALEAVGIEMMGGSVYKIEDELKGIEMPPEVGELIKGDTYKNVNAVCNGKKVKWYVNDFFIIEVDL